MKKVLRSAIFIFTLFMFISGTALAALPIDVPREDTLILDQIFRYPVANNFNLWTPGAGALPTRQAFVADTFWYIDQQTGEWINSLAREKPIYNDDYTEMKVNLRKGIYWSDGVEFTADDVVFTIKTLKANSGMYFSQALNEYVDRIEKTGKYSVKFYFNKSNSRFHYNFTSDFYATYIMPKHIWKDVKNPTKYDFYPVVSLGAYVQEDGDPAGYWELFKRRDDWERTTAGVITGKPGPKYILTIAYGDDAKKVMAMANHDLDLVMNLNFESFEALRARSKTARSWFKDFPWAWPNELSTRRLEFNLGKDNVYQNKDVRWALSLALDIVDLQTEYLGGTAPVAALSQPYTPFMYEHYYKPLKPWLKDFTIKVADGETFKPFDDQVPAKIAAWAKEQGYNVPTDPVKEEKLFGIGWWKYAPKVAEKLLDKNGFRRNDKGQWLLPDGTPWEIDIMAMADEVDSYRLALGAQYQLQKFGIKVKLDTVDRNTGQSRMRMGDYTVQSYIAGPGSANAVVDKWPYIEMLDSKYYVPNGKSTSEFLNPSRLKDPKIDEFIEEMGAVPPGNPKLINKELDYFKYMTKQRYFINLTGFKKFIIFDEKYWSNFPTGENPYGQPCYWFLGSKFVLPYLEKVNN